jgi:hypothetical protein
VNYRITCADNAVTTLVIKLFGAEIISSLDKEQTSASYLLFMNSSEEQVSIRPGGSGIVGRNGSRKNPGDCN